MISITNIPIEVIKDFLLENNYKIAKVDKEIYDSAENIILNNKADYYPDTIIDWIIAYNFFTSDNIMRMYKLTEINNLSKKELNDLARKLGLDNNDRQSIINVLTYLHKIETLQLLSDDIKFAELLPKLGLPAFLSFCAIDVKHRRLCDNDNFWKYLYEKDYGNEKLKDDTYKNNYILAYQAEKLSKDLKLFPKIIANNKIDLVRGFLKVERLDLIGLTSLPKEIDILTNLKRLVLINDNLTDLPKEIGNLINLTYLNLSHNKLINLPKEIGKLYNLEYLYLADNLLTELPKEVGNLVKLKELDISINEITVIPEELLNLQQLEYFDYDGNFIKDIAVLSTLNNIIYKNFKRLS